MLIKLLTKDDTESLISIAEFLSIADKPMLWDGKPIAEASERIQGNYGKFSFARGEAESALLADWRNKPVVEDFKGVTEAEKHLINLLREVPHELDNAAPEVRASAVSTVLRKLHEDNRVSNRYAIRVVLFELMLMAFADGKISALELHVLREMQHHYEVDDVSFSEILEQAESVSKVSQRTLALILE